MWDNTERTDRSMPDMRLFLAQHIVTPKMREEKESEMKIPNEDVVGFLKLIPVDCIPEECKETELCRPCKYKPVEGGDAK